MNGLLVGTEMDGAIVAVPFAQVAFIRQGVVGTEIYTLSGAVLRVQEELEQMGIAIYHEGEGSQGEEVGVAPPEQG